VVRRGLPWRKGAPATCGFVLKGTKKALVERARGLIRDCARKAKAIYVSS
jgi:hypothetical protein